MGEDHGDPEGRVITLRFKDATLVNAYVPCTSLKGDITDRRTEFEKEMIAHVLNEQSLCKARKLNPFSVYMQGDYNVAAKTIDSNLTPERQKTQTSATDAERELHLRMMARCGLEDCFRIVHGGEKRQYTWEGPRLGWKMRLDYFFAPSGTTRSRQTAEDKRPRVADVVVSKETYGSNHRAVRTVLRPTGRIAPVLAQDSTINTGSRRLNSIHDQEVETLYPLMRMSQEELNSIRIPENAWKAIVHVSARMS